MERKIALVTGGTSGVGLSIVKELVKNNVFVYFIGSSKEKGKPIELEVNGGNGSVCRFIELDLSNLNSVREFANKFESEVTNLDILLNVAGVTLPKRQETSEGLEKTFAIGYLSAFLLSRELIPILSNVSQSRIINVGGIPSQMLKPRLDFENLNFAQNYSGIRVAFDTVHAKTVLTEILAEQLKSKEIDVNAFHPGAVKSDIGRNMNFPLNHIFKMMSLFMSNKSESGIYLSISDEVKGVTGQLFVKKKPIQLNFEKEYKDQLWTLTEGIVEKVLS